MKKFLFFIATLALFSSAYSFTIVPASTGFCLGSSMTLRDTLTTGGIWSSSNPAIATIGSSSGVMTGISAGVVTITYTLGGSYGTETYTVSPVPASIAGGSVAICSGSTTTVSDATPGGTWSSSGGVTIGTAGVVTGIWASTPTIYYTVGGCSVSTTITVNATPMGGITGPYTVCIGGTVTLTDSVGVTGIWSSGSPSLATIGSSSGIVTGISAGTDIITYTSTGICGPAYATRAIIVSGTTSAGTISGISSLPVGGSVTLSETVGGGLWSSSSPSVVSIGSSSGLTFGLSAGTTTMTYSVTGCGGIAYATYPISVTPFDGISGYVRLRSGTSLDSVRLYLIHYDPATLMLQALDSATYRVNDTQVYYQFTGLGTDSFRIKAAAIDTMHWVTGYIPTYHTSAFYWHSANVVYHTAGTADIMEDIIMSYGTPVSGVGFIGGSVLTGANKGTSGGSPVAGLKMVLVNSTTNQTIQFSRTNAAGDYSFTSVPVGQTYYVFPDSLNYLTTPYNSITLTSAGSSMTHASFTQHTVSHTITPVLESVSPVNIETPQVMVDPNPSTGILKLKWILTTNETGAVTISDMTGRVLMNKTIEMNKGTGTKQLDLSGLANGTYVISVKSASLDYNNKIQVAH